jgi:hypothetical protein
MRLGDRGRRKRGIDRNLFAPSRNPSLALMRTRHEKRAMDYRIFDVADAGAGHGAPGDNPPAEHVDERLGSVDRKTRSSRLRPVFPGRSYIVKTWATERSLSLRGLDRLWRW